MTPKEILERVMRHVRKARNGCWLWTGATAGKGYPVFKIKGVNKSVRRMVYAASKRKPTQGKKALWHEDGCPMNCVNPDHLHVNARLKGGRPKGT